jgi:hypothetical protein
MSLRFGAWLAQKMNSFMTGSRAMFAFLSAGKLGRN